MYKIYITEDDTKISSLISENLIKWGYITEITHDFHEIIKEISAFSPDLILMDINLPVFDGFYWCSEIRKISSVPVIFISSRDSSMDIVMAMNMGGDDFIQKPFSMEVLIAKIKAILRRTYSYTDTSLNIQERNGIILNLNERCLYYGKEKIDLTANEFRIISVLFENAGKVVKREKIIKELWQQEDFVDDNTLTVNINRLRKKLISSGINDFIETKKGEGYIIK
ncbi:MAG: response regulator transcription factor [Thermotogae bacterium]|nr:response regulator transcription factor [Thermotogota bacterium]